MSRTIASSSSRPPPTAARSPESFESQYRRNAAAEILQSYEKLSWYSYQRCESLTQTRLHFQNIVAGFTEEDEAALIDWKEDFTPRPKPVGDLEKGKRKGKDRVSSVVAESSAQRAGSESGRSDSGASGSAKKKRRSGLGE